MSWQDEDKQLEIDQIKRRVRLVPARNVRQVIPRCCGTCKHHTFISGAFVCDREDGFEGDLGDGGYWLHTCDLWANGIKGERWQI